MAASVAWLMTERELNQRVLHCCSLERHLLVGPSDVECLNEKVCLSPKKAATRRGEKKK
jgi:hypothetical protein